jgi:tetratricopeptide (TPR) repeat protein
MLMAVEKSERMKRLGLIILVFLISCTFNSGAAQEVSIGRGRDLLKHGSYKEALSVFDTLVQRNATDRDAVEGRAVSQFALGQYEAAETRIKAYLKDNPVDAALRVVLADIQLETGRYGEAAAEFEHASRDGKGPTMLRALLGRARALRAQGKDDEAEAVLQQVVRNNNSSRNAEELTAIAQALVYLEKYKDANEFFIDAREADPTYIEAFIGQGDLLREKYRYGDSASLFDDALKLNPNSMRALVGRVECSLDSGVGPTAGVDQALAVNPNYPDALVLRARMDLETDNYDAVSKSLQHALAVNPNSVEALGVRASMLYLQDKKAELEADTKRALAINPRAGEFFNTLAHFANNNRRYADAVDFGRRAVELSPRLWRARTQYGIELLRVGRMAEGRAELERTFAGDPFNLWAKNSLDLLDSMRDYTDTVRGPFLIKSAQKESGALSVYAADLLEEAYKKLTAKYRFTPRAPLSVEIFPNHEDFAVRSLGLPGLGALGVCFGQVIAMDSPSARRSGEFNWGSTLWHEFTHVITLQITDHRIPRWFSEGLSVYEERRARPGWGENWSLDKLKAVSDGKFVSINDLDAAFTRPRSPEGVGLAYFQASQVCEFVEEKFSFDGILRMLALYKEGAKTPDVLQRALKLAPADFDRAFNEYIRSKTSSYIEAIGTGPLRGPGNESPSKESLAALLKTRPNDYFAHLRLGAIYKNEGDADRAIEHLRRAAEVFPYYGREGNVYAMLAEIYESRGQKAEAAAALETLTRYNETNVEALTKLARLRLSLGDQKGALRALETTFYIQPFDASLHKLAGSVYLEQGSGAEATREFRALVALTPPDLAEAHYDLARSLDASGNRAEARREVLRALEIAPGFEKAQELLLKLRGGN